MSSRDPIQYNYLVFDDEDEEANQNTKQVRVDGFSCNLAFVNPTHFFNPHDNSFNEEAFLNDIVEKTRGHYIRLIATDWNMLRQSTNYPEVNGLQIIEALVKVDQKYRKCPFIIYSGQPRDASEALLKKLQQEIGDGKGKELNTLQLLSLLMELRIKFCSRNVRFDEIKTMIKGEKSISLIVLNSLAKFENNLIVNTGNSYYDGKTIGQLIEMITPDNDQGLKFIREIIELAIANYTEINE